MNDLGCIQHSPEWYSARIGMITASKIAAVVRKRKTGTKELQARYDLKIEILSEILSDRTKEHYVSPAMDWGIENEPRARAEYEIYKEVSVEPVGLLLHPTMSRAAASPDGYIPQDGLLEIKCPNTSTHLEYIMGGIVPHDYRPQMLWQMACAGPEVTYCDFVSYDPRLASEFQLFIARLDRDDKIIAEMESAAEEFITEVNAMALRLQQYASGTIKTLEKSIAQAERDLEAKLQITDEDTVAGWRE